MKVARSLEELPELMPEKTASEYLGKHPNTMLRYRQRGCISYRKMGGIFYTRDDIREFIERSKREAVAA